MCTRGEKVGNFIRNAVNFYQVRVEVPIYKIYQTTGTVGNKKSQTYSSKLFQRVVLVSDFLQLITGGYFRNYKLYLHV